MLCKMDGSAGAGGAAGPWPSLAHSQASIFIPCFEEEDVDYLIDLLNSRIDITQSWTVVFIVPSRLNKDSGCKLNGELPQCNAAHRLLLTGTPLQNGIEEP